MRLSFSLLAILLLLSLSLAANTTEVNLFVFDYLGENETFTKIPFNLSSGEHYIISIEDEPSFILHANANITMITSREGIRNALLGYYATQGTTQQDLKFNQTYIQELSSLINSYNETRLKEFECKTYIGIDRFPCVDYDTCWRACYTPICQQLKVGAGKAFLELIWAFSNMSSYIDSNISAFNERLNSFSEFTSEQQVAELTDLIDNMRNNSLAINNNDLFNPMAMGFCKVVGYNLTQLTQAKIKLLTTRDRLLPLLIIDDTTDSIYNNTMQRVSLKAQFRIDRLCSNLISNNSLDFSSIKANLSSLNTSKMKEKLYGLEEAMKLEGCNSMNEAQIQDAQLQSLNLSNQVPEYGRKLKEVVQVRNEVGSLLAGIQGDALLYFRLGEFNSRFNDLNAKIDSAELAQLPTLESQLLELSGEIESAKENKSAVFLSSILPFLAILAVAIALIVILYILTRRKGRKEEGKGGKVKGSFS